MLVIIIYVFELAPYADGETNAEIEKDVEGKRQNKKLLDSR